MTKTTPYHDLGLRFLIVIITVPAQPGSNPVWGAKALMLAQNVMEKIEKCLKRTFWTYLPTP